MKQDIIDYLKDKKILVLGYGREGKSALAFLQTNLPENTIAVADQNELQLDNVQTICGDNYLDAVRDFDVVIKSPGIPTRFCRHPISSTKSHPWPISSYVSAKILSLA